MEKIVIDDILENVLKTVKAHELETGKYSRFVWKNDERDLNVNPYGCADAANILYTLNRFPSDTEVRKKCIDVLQGMQDRETGLFCEGTHHKFHTTAHCVAALELFDVYPLYPIKEMEKYKDFKEFSKMCEDMDWLHKGGASHPGAGIYASLVITDAVGGNWTEEHFAWFDKNCDSNTGLWVKEPAPDYPISQRMGESFHFLFNYEHAKHPFPYPDKLIDSCIAMYKNKQLPEYFGKQFHFIEVDWVYCLNRASRQTPHRFYEVKEILYDFAKDYIDFLKNVNWEEKANDLHVLFGTTCCLAELQLALPGKIYSSRPLRMTLDRRPFI